MSATLNQMLSSSDPPELIDPIELSQEDVPGKELVAVCLLGIFNPMGPTLVAINLVAKEGQPSVAVLYTSLNPFGQTRLLIARTPNDPASVFATLEASYQVGDALILGGWPTLVLPATQDPECQAALHQMLFGLLNAVSPGEPVSKVLADLRNHLGDPWGRIPSFEEMMQQSGGGVGDNEADPISEKDFGDWIALMGERNHVINELQAIVQAWNGSIQNFGRGLPHMSVEEMTAEFKALGYPFFR